MKIRICWVLLFFFTGCLTKQDPQKFEEDNKKDANFIEEDRKLSALEKVMEEGLQAEDAMFPKEPDYYYINQFMKKKRAEYEQLVAVEDEYEYLKFFLWQEEPNRTEQELTDLKKLIEENYLKYHWVYLYAHQNVVNYFVERAKDDFISQREQEFVKGMRVIAYLSLVLRKASKEDKYFKFSRKFYADMSQKYFNRELTDDEKSILAEQNSSQISNKK